jgi:hypothetical protein
MSVKLEWEIESEQRFVREESGEDPESRRRRRRRRLWVLLIPLVLLAIVVVFAVFVLWRLRQADARIERNLQDTVDAEIATLRLGDQRAFLDFQRSATDDWMQAQRNSFDTYQTQKIAGSVQLTGRILDVTVDGTRARVQVEEIVDSAPYVRTWFYWRYDDGWHHVPPDYTFWGESALLEADRFSILYQAVDAPLARAMQTQVASWLATGCASLDCAGLAPIRIEVQPAPGLKTAWNSEDAWRLQVRSPYTNLARADAPFDFALQFEVANLLAERLVAVAAGEMQPVYPADAFYLYSSLSSWLVGRFVSINTNAFLLESLATNYGAQAPGQLLQSLTPEASVDVLTAITGPLAQANLDWRDFLTWRLALEDELMNRQDEANFLGLYHTGDEQVRALAYERYNAGPSGARWVVTSVQSDTLPDGGVQVRALAEMGEQRLEALFQLVNGRWRRVN